MKSTRTASLAATIVVGSALTACATTRHSDQLDQARTEVRTLSQEPLAQQAAADDLRSAQDRLQEAENAEQHHRPPESVDHLAYLAERHAEAGEARVHAAAAQQDLARQQQQRTQIMLSSREQQAQRNAQEAESAKEQLRNTQQELAELKAKPAERGPTITLSDVLFDTGAATLKPGADLTLGRLADYLKAHPQTRVMIEGHTDSRGSEEYNEALSRRRADAVAAALRERGVSEEAMQAIGRGKAYPIATNDTPEGRQQNRRVEIILSNASGRFAQDAATPPTG